MIKQEETKLVCIKDIELGDRQREDLGDISQLAYSMEKYGLLHPPAVKDLGGGKYRLLAGGRRIAAAVHLKWFYIRCTIYHRDLSDLELRSIELIENIDRKDLTWQEEDGLVKQIHELQIEIYGESTSRGIRTDLGQEQDPEEIGWSIRKTADLIGKKKSMVSLILARAKATQLSPRIAACKTGMEAWKMLEGAKAKVSRQIRVEAYEEKHDKSPEGILKKRLIDSYIVADALVQLKKIKANSIDWIELDPPYGIDLEKTRKSRDANKPGMEEYEEVSVSEYMLFATQIINECHRVLTSEGWLVWWFGMDWYFPILNRLLQTGFLTPTLPAIWTKGAYQAQTMQPSMYLANSYETFFYARKPNAQIQKKGRTNEFNFRNISPQHKSHPAERPIEMMMEILGTFCQANSTGLVPFLGSGNTILAANNLKMMASGFDLSQDYKDGYIVKVNEGRIGQFKSYKGEEG